MTAGLLPAVRGAVGFLSRVPIGRGARDWEAFERTPAAFPLSGYLIGASIGLPVALVVALGFPTVSVAVVGLFAVYAITGINNLDGLIDLGDAAVVHGDPDDRADVLKDTTVGVGAVSVAVVALVALAFGFYGLGRVGPVAVFGVVMAAEVGAKLSMAGIACVGTARHEGLGSAFTENAESADLAVPAVVSLPVVAVGAPVGAILPVTGALVGAVLGGWLLASRANSLLGGVNGDVFGATNEVARLVGLHVGVIAWTLS
ncbi:adenosylcobinamide-GDP ribazoletransferase [Halalkaliarchaeum desulfuricum]|uniref:Adenosylcobinamide-GDP ribazoletransferase n=1 Tax=Halalkaliarchaeum desulfuricum TaxID=2055893 RepID=A0A343TL49_9EURY|nr:adenosylcobinamide-GDP ribazoletransferase [Halalkaliarchaeum desulfuricum]AUX09821.1 adenosylcobinamide-GDP ribazoletransferase [Halalkaliarchaeum desulfuricum]